MDAIACTDVSKSYGNVLAVDRLNLAVDRAVNLAVETGRTVALLGPNGAGKSTSINLLLGLLAPGSGTVRVFGGTPEAAIRGGRLAAMPQEGGLVSRTTVGELLAFVSGTYPSAAPTTGGAGHRGAGGLPGRRVERLSGGQAQRLRFALALAGDPELILLDEPTAALDVRARREFWESMRGLRRARPDRPVLHPLPGGGRRVRRPGGGDRRGRIAADGTAAAGRRPGSPGAPSPSPPPPEPVAGRSARGHQRDRDRARS